MHAHECNSVQITIGDMGSLIHAYECNSVQITIGDMGSLMHAYECDSVHITIGDMASLMLAYAIHKQWFFQKQWGKHWTSVLSVLNCIFILIDMMMITSSCFLSIMVWYTVRSNLPNMWHSQVFLKYMSQTTKYTHLCFHYVRNTASMGL